MKITSRPYQRDIDFERVSQFLIGNYLPDNMNGNWLQPAWNYMHSHPNLDFYKVLGFREIRNRIYWMKKFNK
jgi:hypothetical protein